MLGDPVLDVAGLDRLPIPEDLKDGKQEAIPSWHLARGLRAIIHARQAIRATENHRISVCSPFTGVSLPCGRPPPRDIREPSAGTGDAVTHPPHSRTGPRRHTESGWLNAAAYEPPVLSQPDPNRGEPGKLGRPGQPMRPRERFSSQARWRPHRRPAWPRVDPWRWRRRRAARDELCPACHVARGARPSGGRQPRARAARCSGSLPGAAGGVAAPAVCRATGGPWTRHWWTVRLLACCSARTTLSNPWTESSHGRRIVPPLDVSGRRIHARRNQRCQL